MQLSLVLLKSIFMNRREFLRKLGFSAGAVALTGCSKLPFQGRGDKDYTNFIIIFTDDQGYADLGCYGAEGFTTPNIDMLAGQGIRFTDFYVSQAVCSASRASLLTGCYSNRIGIKGALNPYARTGINSNEQTIAEILKKKGYATGIFGKWHLGHHRKFLPLQHGFDDYFGLPYSNDMWPLKYDGTDRRANYPKLPLISGNGVVDYIETLQDQATLTTQYTERAVQFIEKNKHAPFFLYLPHAMPHVPLGVSDKFKGKSKQGMYGDVIMEIDWSVGQIMKTLKKNGLENNTLVIFISDNGPWLNFGNHAGSAGPLREGKGSMWDGGARVPCVMRWPGHIPQGSVCNKIAATIDILPTITRIAGGRLPEHIIDGVNILSLLEAEKNAEPREHYFFYYVDELQAVRQGKWKLHFPHKYRSYKGIKPGKDGLKGSSRTKSVASLELYNLEKDIGETTNLAEQYPEVVAELTVLAETARKDIGDSLTKRKGKNVRPPGKI